MKALIQICILSLALCANAQGYVEAIPEYSSPVGGIDDGTIGFTFRANANLTVTELGVFNYVFATVGPIEVAIWNAAGAQQGSTIVSSTSSFVNQTRYETLTTPVSLVANEVYFIGAYIPSDTGINMAGEMFGGSYQLFPWINYLGYARVDGVSLTKPVAVPGAELVVPGVANFRIVPEPGTMSLILLGGAVFGFLRRSRR